MVRLPVLTRKPLFACTQNTTVTQPRPRPRNHHRNQRCIRWNSISINAFASQRSSFNIILFFLVSLGPVKILTNNFDAVCWHSPYALYNGKTTNAQFSQLIQFGQLKNVVRWLRLRIARIEMVQFRKSVHRFLAIEHSNDVFGQCDSDNWQRTQIWRPSFKSNHFVPIAYRIFDDKQSF